MNFKTIFLLAIATIICSYSSFAQQHTTELDDLFNSRYASEISGASILVSKNGKIIYKNQQGFANIENEDDITNETKFAIGSITKQFTAAAILKLQEQHKLKLTDKIAQHLPQFQEEGFNKITITHLLTHTSGLPSNKKELELNKGSIDDKCVTDFTQSLVKENLQFNPGSQYDYSNSGYILLGLIIEKTSGIPYAKYLSDYIFKPNNMTNTYVVFNNEHAENVANGYMENDDESLIGVTPRSSSYAAGAIISTLSDLNKWATSLFNEKIITSESMALMLHNYKLNNGEKLNLGLGWEINEVSGHHTFEHSGFEPGFKINAIYVPSEKLYVVIAQNSEINSPTPTTIKATAICLNKPYPNKVELGPISKSQIDMITGTYELASGKKRFILEKEGSLHYKREGGKASPLFFVDNNTLVFDREYIQLEIADNNTIVFHNRNSRTLLKKISNEVPIENVAIRIPQEILTTYVGSFKSEQFTMHITVDDENLFAQPEGSDKLQLQAKGENKFFIEEIGAEIEFVSNESKQISHINIILEGHTMKGERVIN